MVGHFKAVFLRPETWRNPCHNLEMTKRSVPNAQKQITFGYEPNKVIVELLLVPDQTFKFLVKDHEGTALRGSYLDDNPPSSKYVAYVQNILPSAAETYGSTAELFCSVKSFIHRYFACSADFEVIATLFIFATWTYEKFSAMPYLRFLGQPGCGKSRALTTIGQVCYRGISMAGTTTGANLFRIIDAFGGTLIMDEADFQHSQVGSDIAKILNSGYEKGKPVFRSEKTRGGGFEPRPFDVYGPKLLGGRETFRDHAVESRCIRYMPLPPIDRRDISKQLPAEFYSDSQSIRNQLLQWRLDHLDQVTPLSGIEETELSARTEQIYIPLLTVAEYLGGDLKTSSKSIVLDYARDSDNIEKAERGDSNESLMLQAWLCIKGKKPTTNDLCIQVKESFGVDVSHLQAGPMLNGMGFSNKHTNRGSVRSLSPLKEADLIKRFGLDQNLSDESDSGDGLSDKAAELPAEVLIQTGKDGRANCTPFFYPVGEAKALRARPKIRHDLIKFPGIKGDYPCESSFKNLKVGSSCEKQSHQCFYLF